MVYYYNYFVFITFLIYSGGQDLSRFLSRHSIISLKKFPDFSGFPPFPVKFSNHGIDLTYLPGDSLCSGSPEKISRCQISK